MNRPQRTSGQPCCHSLRIRMASLLSINLLSGCSDIAILLDLPSPRDYSQRWWIAGDWMTTTPVSLLQRLRQPSCSDAWSHFVQLYTPLLYHWAHRSGFPRHEADDLVQDVFATLV